MNIREAVSKIEIFQAATPSSMAELIPALTLRKHTRGEHLFLDKNMVTQFYFLADGFVSLYKISSLNEKKVIFVYGAGAMINEVAVDEKPASIYCDFLEDSVTVSIERDRFLKICAQDFNLSKAVMDSMALKIRRLYHQLKNSGNTLRGDKRIAAKLWKMSKDHGIPCSSGTKINFRFTVTFLAELLGSKRETVSRQLKLLTEQNLVIIEKNRFIIPDRDKLLKYFSKP